MVSESVCRAIILPAVFADNVEPEAYIAEKGLLMVSDDKVVFEVVALVLNDHPNAVEDYRSGKDKAFSFLMGQVMKKLGGAGNPDVAKRVLKEMLDNEVIDNEKNSKFVWKYGL